jgi:capsule biosynthesis phosphatase
MPKIVIDLDGTLTIDPSPEGYPDKRPDPDVVAALKDYKARGFEIAIFTSRNMRTFAGSVGKINAFTLPAIVAWLDKHGVPYDEIHVGKPWCEHGGFYVDDKAIRPSEFKTLSYEEIIALLGREAPQ